jgi:CHAT domain-containing protein/tetratricopeptide (TPR) repeat protein
VRIGLKVTIVALTSLPPMVAGCIRIETGQTFNTVLSSSHPACFSLELRSGHGTQLMLEQPSENDIALALNSAAGESLVDSFEFGRETVTIAVPGTYRVDVRVLSPGAALKLSMTRKTLPLQTAIQWRDAEIAATRSKASGKAADIEASLAQWKAIGDADSIARTYLRLGDNAIDADNGAGARAAYEIALDMCRSIPDLRCAAEAANNSGWAAQLVSDFDGSRLRLMEARDLWRQLGNRALEALTLSNLGLLMHETGDFQEAIGFFMQARSTTVLTDPVAHARVLNNLGLCYLSLAEYGRARTYLRQALAIYRVHKSVRDEVMSRGNMARAEFLDGNFPAAEALLEHILTLTPSDGDRIGRARALGDLGQVFLKQGRFSQAEIRLTEALTLVRAIGDRRDEAFNLYYLGLAARGRGNTGDAARLIGEALEIQRACGLRDPEADSLAALAELQHDNGNSGAAGQYAERALDILESLRGKVPGPELRASYYARRRKLLDLIVDLETESQSPQSAATSLLAAERGRARSLLDLLTEASTMRPLPPELIARRDTLDRTISMLAARLSNAPAGKEGSLRGRIEPLLAEREETQAQIRQAAQGNAVARSLASIDELQREGLLNDAALLEYHLGERRSYLWLVRRNSVEVFNLPARREIEALCARVTAPFGRILDRRRSPAKLAAFNHSLAAASAVLLGPLAGIPLPQRLILAPDGVLHALPFAALRLASESEPLGIKHDLIQVPAAGLLLAGRSPRPIREFPKTVLVVADPVYSSQDPRMPAAKSGTPANSAGLARLPFGAEIDALDPLTPPAKRTILRGFEASPATVGAARLQDFALIHFSAHAIMDDRTPELSRIALSAFNRGGQPIDGGLRPYQFAQWRLDGAVVALSACDTALGRQMPGEGFLGFSASLFAAGASQLVLTLTEVDAEGSSQFFSQVYRNYLGSRTVAMDHAMTLARQTMRNQPRWKDPYYWASFVVVGRPASNTVDPEHLWQRVQ